MTTLAVPSPFVRSYRTATSRKWLQVAAASALINTSYGTMSYAFSVLNTRTAAGGDLGVSGFGLAFSAGVLVSGLAAPWIGTIADLFGVRRMLAVGSFLGLLGLCALSFCQSAWQAVLVEMLILAPAMAATFYEPVYVLMNRWFEAHERPRAYGVLTLMSGVSITIFTPLTQSLVDEFGWRAAVRVLGAILVVIGVAVALVLREPAPAVRAQRPSLIRETWRGAAEAPAEFWWFALAFAGATLAMSGFTFHAIAVLHDDGFDRGRVAAAFAITGILSLPARLMLPALANRISANTMLTACLLLVGSAAFIVASPAGWFQVWLYVGIYGAAFGAVFPLRALVTSQRFSGEFFGRMMGLQALLLALSRAAGPAIVGLAGESGPGFPATFRICGVALLVAAIVMYAGGRRRAV